MGDTEKCNTEMMQRLHSSFGSTTSSSSSIPKSLNQNQHQLELNPNFINRSAQFSQFSQQSPFTDSGNNNNNNNKRIGVLPPTSPYSQIPTTRPGFNPGPTPTQTHHSRSMSQPNSFFSFDSLPPLSPSPFLRNNNDSTDVSMEDSNREFTNTPSFLPPSSSQFTRCNSTTTSSSSLLPPRKSHRRSNSDNIPNVFNNSMMIQNSIPPRPLERSVSGGECVDWSKTSPFVKKESSSSCEREGVGEKEAMDDLFSAYMNLDNIDVLNSSEADDSKNENNREDMESSRASGTKTNNGSDTEGESSSVNESGGNNLNYSSGGDKKRRAGGGDIAPTSRHFRSVSVDSCFMEKLSSFGDEISSLKPPPSPGSLSRKVSPTNSVDGGNSAGFSIEFKNGEFTAAEMKKIMGNDKLAEMAMSDPKRVKRILANRQSAARSKERKMRYIVELEHKVQTLQTEATTLSAQLTLLQRDMMGLTNQNNELKFRLQAMEQQARLRDALNEALNGEVQRLKLAIGEANQNESDRSTKMQSLNAEMFQQLNISQIRPQQAQSQAQSQSQQNQNGTMATTKPESNE